MKNFILLLTLFIAMGAKADSVDELKSARLLKNKYGEHCLEAREQLIKKIKTKDIKKVEEVIWAIENEILQLGIMRARDLDLRDLIVIWIKKFGPQKVLKNPNILFTKLGAHPRYIHSFRLALKRIEGDFDHPDMNKVSMILNHK